MTNPFSGIITDAHKSLYKNMVMGLLEGVSTTCRLVYGDTIFTDCPNCLWDGIKQRSANRYTAGGPVSFPNGTICPYCNGQGRFGTESTEDIELGVIWDYKMFVSLGDNEPILNLKNPTGMIQTISRVDTTVDKLRRAKKLIAATEKETVVRQTFEKASEPDFGGLGEHHFMIMLWKRLK